MNELISVIIPIYNQEKYLSRCLDSIISQTYRHLEIILIDDGSIDSSNKIMQKYADNDARIHILHKTNGGLSDARNAGLDIATGEYVTFVDSDDWIDKGYINILHQKMIEYCADIVSVGLLKIWDSKEQKVKATKRVEVLEYDREQAVTDMWYQREIDNCACGKLYRMSLFQEIRYPVGKLYEDLATTYQLIWKADKIIHLPRKLYYYFQHTGSIMARSFDRRNLDRIFVSEELLNWARGQSEAVRKAAEVRFFVSNIQVLREIPIGKEYSKEISLIQDNIKKYRKRVWKNRKAKTSIRCIACFSMLNIRVLKQLGHLYKLIYR